MKSRKKIKAGQVDLPTLPTLEQKAAMDAASSPGADNPFLTKAESGASAVNTRSEVLIGAVDGVNRTFRTAEPYNSGSIKVFLNGLKTSYFQEVTSNTILFEDAPKNTGFIDKVEADYLTN
jgi:hypothetical protein